MVSVISVLNIQKMSEALFWATESSSSKKFERPTQQELQAVIHFIRTIN